MKFSKIYTLKFCILQDEPLYHMYLQDNEEK